MIPLGWKRSIEPLPYGNRLDCWYLWNAEIRDDAWQLDPQRIVDGKIANAEEQARLEFLIFEAEIETQTRSHRLHCPSLLASLAAKSQGGTWVVPELDGSISVWADTAFQLYHGRLE
jgi:hypothetical protein